MRPLKLKHSEALILDLLSDGERHSRIEILTHIGKGHLPPSRLRWWMYKLRRKMHLDGRYIICERYRWDIFYRCVLKLLPVHYEKLMSYPFLTPTQKRILLVLSDGLPHHRSELIDCLQDEYATPKNMSAHLYNIRGVLRPRGEDIICELKNRTIFYRHVRLLKSPYGE